MDSYKIKYSHLIKKSFCDIYFWKRTHYKPDYLFNIDMERKLDPESSDTELKERYEYEYSKHLNQFNDTGYFDWVVSWPIPFYSLLHFKKFYDEIKNKKDFHQYITEIDWEN